MQITVTIPDELAEQVQARGLSPEGYVEALLAEKSHSMAPVAEKDTAARLADLAIFLKRMSAHSHEVPVLPDEAFTRESFYQDHD